MKKTKRRRSFSWALIFKMRRRRRGIESERENEEGRR